MGRLIRRAAAPRTGFITADDVKRALTEAGYGKFLQSPYEHADWNNVDWQGSWGMYGHQMVGLGVSSPIIYCGEVHTFKLKQEMTSFIVVFRLTDDGAVNNAHAADVQSFQETPATCAKRLGGFYRLRDGRNVKFGFYTFDEAVDAAKKYIDKRSTQIQGGDSHDQRRDRLRGQG